MNILRCQICGMSPCGMVSWPNEGDPYICINCLRLEFRKIKNERTYNMNTAETTITINQNREISNSIEVVVKYPHGNQKTTFYISDSASGLRIRNIEGLNVKALYNNVIGIYSDKPEKLSKNK